jgi:hypothetical protein
MMNIVKLVHLSKENSFHESLTKEIGAANRHRYFQARSIAAPPGDIHCSES